MNEYFEVIQMKNPKQEISANNKGIVTGKNNFLKKNLSFTPPPMKETLNLSNSIYGKLDNILPIINYMNTTQDSLLIDSNESAKINFCDLKNINLKNNNISPYKTIAKALTSNDLFSYKKTQTDKLQPLSKKMSNFLENYDDLIDIIGSSNNKSNKSPCSDVVNSSKFFLVEQEKNQLSKNFKNVKKNNIISNFNEENNNINKKNSLVKLNSMIYKKYSDDKINKDCFLPNKKIHREILKQNENNYLEHKEIISSVINNKIEEKEFYGEKDFKILPVGINQNNKKNNKEYSLNFILNPLPINVSAQPQNLYIDNFVTAKERKLTICEDLNIQDDINVEDTKKVENLTNTEEIKDFYEYTEDCLKRIINLNIPSLDEIKDLLIDLPFEFELKTKKLAIFDLDETLIHCEIKKPSKGQVQIMVNLPSGEKAKIGLNIRPYWKECLKELSNYYLIIVYTASHKSYADSVLDYLDPKKDLIKHRLYRHNCVRVQMDTEFIYVKDLRIFKNVKIENMIIIDNSVLSFSFQLENGIPILPFYDNKDDIELKYLTNYLGNIYNVDDLRMENNRSIKMDYFLKSVKEKLINNNYKSNEDNGENSITSEERNSNKYKIDENVENPNNLFSINLFSSDLNNNDISTLSEMYCETITENSEYSENGENLVLNSNYTNETENNEINPNYINSKRNSETIFLNTRTSSNGNESSNSKQNNRKEMKKNSTFQDELFSTLEDLKKTFGKISKISKFSNECEYK